MAINTKQHDEAMAIAHTILFLRKHDHEDLALTLSRQAIDEGMPEELVSVAWMEPA